MQREPVTDLEPDEPNEPDEPDEPNEPESQSPPCKDPYSDEEECCGC